MFHAMLGMVTEAGELADNWKKAIFYGGRTFDHINADEEVGDLLWYVMLYCMARGDREGTTGAQHFARIMAGNAAKLRARYPGKFDTQQAEKRDTDAEINAMKKAME
jgi:NTP pyrophosphatase (non-canonical NTP hydrolase)